MSVWGDEYVLVFDWEWVEEVCYLEELGWDCGEYFEEFLLNWQIGQSVFTGKYGEIKEIIKE